MAVTRCDLAKALRGTQGFRQPLASAVRPENGPGWSLCFQTRAWAGDTQSRSPPAALGPLALGDGRAAGEAAMAARRSVTEVGLPSGARVVGDGWGHTGQPPAQPLAPASTPASAFGAAVPTPARPSHSSKYVVRGSQYFLPGKRLSIRPAIPPAIGKPSPPRTLSSRGHHAHTVRDTTCLSSSWQHPGNGPVSLFFAPPAHSPCPARLALNPFICRVFFFKISLFRNTDTFSFHNIISVCTHITEFQSSDPPNSQRANFGKRS